MFNVSQIKAATVGNDKFLTIGIDNQIISAILTEWVFRRDIFITFFRKNNKHVVTLNKSVGD